MRVLLLLFLLLLVRVRFGPFRNARAESGSVMRMRMTIHDIRMRQMTMHDITWQA